jgi:predicted ATPase
VSFIHDSVQSAAYSLLPKEEQASFHLKLGQTLNAKLYLSTSPSHIMFTGANQLARGYELVPENERIEVARIFLRAGDESKSAGAFRGAHYFYAKAISVLRSRGKICTFHHLLHSQVLAFTRCAARIITVTSL